VVDGTPVTILGTLSWSPSRIGARDVVFIAVCVAVIVVFGIAIAVEARRQLGVDGVDGDERSPAAEDASPVRNQVDESPPFHNS
jgi:hypothetical protein